MRQNRRTDTAMGSSAMQRREHKESLKGYTERIAKVKSTLNTRPPSSQPHLTLYGRDYATKKKATTEAAFADLKMIQSIARTMTRKTEVPERKGPVSLNADARKQDIHRIMQENHRMLDHIESVGPFCRTADLVHEHTNKKRYVINASHTCRLSGDYDEEIDRIKREDEYKFQMNSRSMVLRKAAAERMGKSSGSVSLPSLTSASASEPAASAQCGMPVLKKAGPRREWTAPGEAAAAEQRRGARQQAKVGKAREPTVASPCRMSEPSAASTGPRPALRFAAPRPEQPMPTLSEDDEPSTPMRRALRKGGPTVTSPIRAPASEEPHEDLDYDDMLQVEAKPALPRVMEPGHADREEAGCLESILPEPVDDERIEAMPPLLDPLSDAEPEMQQPVLGAEVPLPTNYQEDFEALPPASPVAGTQAASPARRDSSRRLPKAARGGTPAVASRPGTKGTQLSASSTSLLDSSSRPGTRGSFLDDEEGKRAFHREFRPHPIEPSPRDVLDGVEEGVRPNSRAHSPPAGFKMERVNIERTFEQQAMPLFADQGQEEYDDDYEDDYVDEAQQRQEATATFEEEDEDGEDNIDN